jgi:hypothetical protein
LEPILPMYRVGTDLETLEPLISIVNHCVLSILFAHSRNTKLNLKTKEPPDFVRGSSDFRQDGMIKAILAHFHAKSPVFCGLDRTRAQRVTSPM